MDFKKLCMPAQIYLAITILATMFAIFNRVPFMAVIVKLMFAFGWTFVLNWMCSNGYANVSWFLVVFPYVLIMTGYACMNGSRKKH